MRLVDAETVKEYLKRAIWGADKKVDAWIDAVPTVEELLPARYANRVYHEDDLLPYCTCSECGKLIGDEWNYCPRCGAVLREGGETDGDTEAQTD